MTIIIESLSIRRALYAYLRTSIKFAIVFSICAVAIINGIVPCTTNLNNNNNIYNIAFAQTINSINGPINYDNNNNRSISATIDNLNFTSAIGNIASLQNNVTSGEPEWVISGPWQLLVFKSIHEDNNTIKPATVIFNTTFDMASLNGVEVHHHAISISNFKMTTFSNSLNSNHVLTTTFNGTVTVNFLSQILPSQNNVPISIKITDNATISLWIDPTKINYHFGNTPIYGIVLKESG